MTFKALTVSRRLTIGFGVILAILVGVSAVAIVKVQLIKAALVANSSEHA